MGYISRVKDKGLYKKPSFWIAWLIGSLIIISPVGIFLFPALYDSYLSSHSHTEICTVNSAEYDSIDGGGANGPASSPSLNVYTSCGKYAITHIEDSGGMNHGALVKFFNEHQGQKFEFIITPMFNPFNDWKHSLGITSTTPVK